MAVQVQVCKSKLWAKRWMQVWIMAGEHFSNMTVIQNTSVCSLMKHLTISYLVVWFKNAVQPYFVTVRTALAGSPWFHFCTKLRCLAAGCSFIFNTQTWKWPQSFHVTLFKKGSNCIILACQANIPPELSTVCRKSAAKLMFIEWKEM